MSIGEPPSLGCFAASFLQFRSADKAAREPAARPFFALAPVPPTALTSSAAQNGDGRQASPIFVAADQKAEVITQPSGASPRAIYHTSSSCVNATMGQSYSKRRAIG
jgi:hypothetical protein